MHRVPVAFSMRLLDIYGESEASWLVVHGLAHRTMSKSVFKG